MSYLAQKVLQRGQVPVLLTQNNGQKMPIFVSPCILPSHTGFKNIFTYWWLRETLIIYSFVPLLHISEMIILGIVYLRKAQGSAISMTAPNVQTQQKFEKGDSN